MFNFGGWKSIFSTENYASRFDDRRRDLQVPPIRDTSIPPENHTDGLSLKTASSALGATASVQRTTSSLSLVPVSEISEKYQPVFQAFPYFNYVQSTVFDDIFYTDKSVVICAPTGSGKTVIFELAIVRLLMKMDKHEIECHSYKIVYMAPVKALCNERYEDWRKKFDPLGVYCLQLTGDSEADDYFQLQKFTIILTTPEKWDCLTRRWRGNAKFMQMVKLMFIDEIHLLNEEERGATMEAALSRMKTIQRMLLSEEKASHFDGLRFVSASATFPNAEDVAEWLSCEGTKGVSYKMSDSLRPVALRKIILGYPFHKDWSEYRFELSLNYKLLSIIHTYSERKPTLVFCSTRKSVVQTALLLAKQAKFVHGAQHKEELIHSSAMIKDAKLQGALLCGTGFHHAGLEMSDRRIVENMFLSNKLPVLISTSTLAMGVNFPAHLVIIKSTTQYVSGCCKEYSGTQILQMIGRAGRPQFDTSATAVIMTKERLKVKYELLLNGTGTVESSLHKHMAEHLNAEIVLGSITSVDIAVEWLKSTFLYIRAFKNPSYYGIPEGTSKEDTDMMLQDVFDKQIQELSDYDIIKVEDGSYLKSTEVGRLMAKYYLSFETMKKFAALNGSETLPELLTLISECKELEDIQLRVNEKRVLNQFNKSKKHQTIRFPFSEKIKTRAMKISCLVQAVFGCLPVYDVALNQDVTRICTIGSRISQCLCSFLTLQMKGFTAVYNGLILAKCFKTRLWENSKHVSRQLERIGLALSNVLVNAGLTTFKAIKESNPRELEMIMNRNPPFGSTVVECVKHLPEYSIYIQQVDEFSHSTAHLVLSVFLTNSDDLMKKCTSPDHSCTLIIGNADNRIVLCQQILDKHILKHGKWTRRIEVLRADKGDTIDVHLISHSYVGLDVYNSYKPLYKGPKQPYVEQTSEAGRLSQMLKATAAPSANASGLSRKRGKSQTCACVNKKTCEHNCSGGAASRAVKKKCQVQNHLELLNQKLPLLPSKSLKVQRQGEFDHALGLSRLAENFAYRPKVPAYSPAQPSCSSSVTATSDVKSDVEINEADPLDVFFDLDWETERKEEELELPGSRNVTSEPENLGIAPTSVDQEHDEETAKSSLGNFTDFKQNPLKPVKNFADMSHWYACKEQTSSVHVEQEPCTSLAGNINQAAWKPNCGISGSTQNSVGTGKRLSRRPVFTQQRKRTVGEDLQEFLTMTQLFSAPNPAVTGQAEFEPQLIEKEQPVTGRLKEASCCIGNSAAPVPGLSLPSTLFSCSSSSQKLRVILDMFTSGEKQTVDIFFLSNILQRDACGGGSLFIWEDISLGVYTDTYALPRGTLTAERLSKQKSEGTLGTLSTYDDFKERNTTANVSASTPYEPNSIYEDLREAEMMYSQIFTNIFHR